MKISGYANSPALRRLLTMAVLPVVDGFFIAFLQTGMWRDMGQAAVFGMTAFSGGACVIAAMELKGRWFARLAQVAVVYAVLAVSALTIASLQPVFTQALPDNLYLFTGVFLLGLGLHATGAPLLQRIAMWTGFEAVVKVMLTASLLSALMRKGIDWRPALNPELLPFLGGALLAGFGLSVTGALMGLLTEKAADRQALGWGAGTALVLMGLNLLGFTVPNAWVLAPLAAGYLWTVAPVLALSLWTAAAKPAPVSTDTASSNELIIR